MHNKSQIPNPKSQISGQRSAVSHQSSPTSNLQPPTSSPQSPTSNPQLDELVAAVLVSPKYRHIAPGFVRSIGSRELAKRRTWKEAVKATKNKLHQVAGAYLEAGTQYAAWLDELEQTSRSGNREGFLKACAQVMSYHSSTKERIALLDHFYATTLAGLPPIHSILDVACGLNPLAIPWMPLAEDADYYAVDIYQDMADFLNGFMALVPVRGHAQAGDVLQGSPPKPADVALVLKSVPCLEQVDKSAGRRLLDTLDAAHLLVSFPVHSLGGRSKGMAATYEAHFHQLVAGRGWRIERFEFTTELVFRVSK
jgi:16S rRNA (guanine(1405)-N(7))-methyltransferase